MGLFIAAVLAAAAGVYAWAQPPIALAAALLFVASGAAPLRDRADVALDAWLLAALAIVTAQLIPMPASVVATLSPATPSLQDTIALVPFDGWRPLTVRPAATRESLLAALAGVLTFWTTRQALRDGGARSLAAAISLTGVVLAIVTHAQRATAPDSLLWLWQPYAEGVRPYGPFVDRNHLATWIVLAMPVVAGLAVARAVTAGLHQLPPRLLLPRLFSVAGLTVPVVSLALMGLTLVATLSRSGMVAAALALMLAAVLGPGRPERRAVTAIAGLVACAAVALLLDSAGIGERIAATLRAGSDTSRVVIWSETLRLAAEFPIVGTGAGTFADAMLQYQERGTAVLFNHAHNEALQLLTEGGVLLAAAVGGACIAFIARARRTLRHSRGPRRALRTGALAGLAAAAIQSIGDTGLHTTANLLLAATLAALVVHDAEAGRGQPSQSTTV